MKKESFAAIQNVTPASVSHGGDSVSDSVSKHSKIFDGEFVCVCALRRHIITFHSCFSLHFLFCTALVSYNYF